MAPKFDPEVQAKIWKLFQNQNSYKSIQTKLLEENINFSISGIRNVCKRKAGIARNSSKNKNKKPIKPGASSSSTSRTISLLGQKKCPPMTGRTPENIQKVAELTSEVNNPLSQSEIAKLLGVSRGTVHRILHNDLGKAKQVRQTPKCKNQNQNPCIICTTRPSSSLFSKNEEINSKFENNIKSFCQLFSLPSNYFQVELQVSRAIVFERLCHNCRERIQLISSVFTEIGKLKKKLFLVKKSVERDLSRGTTPDFKDELEIREKLQQKLQICIVDTPATKLDDVNEDSTDVKPFLNEEIDAILAEEPNPVTASENTEDRDETLGKFPTFGYIDDTFFDSEPASPANSKSSDPVEDCGTDPDADADAGQAFIALEDIKEEPDEEFSPSNFEDGSSNQVDFASNDPEIVMQNQSKITTVVRSENSTSEVDSRVKECSVVVRRLDMRKWSKAHLETKLVKKANACDHCNRSYTNLSQLRSHERIAHSDIFPFKCDICGARLRTQVYLDKHKRLHRLRDPNIKHQCNTCKAIFQNRSDYAEHKKIHPYVRASRTCELCGMVLKNTNYLVMHQRKHHGMPYPFYCSFCNKGHHSLKSLQEHEVYHQPERYFHCHLCPAKYPLQKALDQHILASHERTERYQCQICPSNYKTKTGLKMHMQVHSGERPWICDVCGMAFLFKRNLKVHSSIHTNERPYLCPECGFTSRLKDLLTSHLKVHEMHRKMRENAANATDDDAAVKKLPVPRLAKPRNRGLRFPKINPITIATAIDAPVIEAEVAVEDSMGLPVLN